MIQTTHCCKKCSSRNIVLNGKNKSGSQTYKCLARSLANFKTTIVLPKEEEGVLEVDEIFSFVFVKVNKIRIWIAQNRQNRQIVSFFIGDGSMESCKRLWRKLPYEYLTQVLYVVPNFWPPVLWAAKAKALQNRNVVGILNAYNVFFLCYNVRLIPSSLFMERN